MKKAKKIQKVYQKLGIKISEDYLNGIMENKPRVKEVMRLYKEEEIDSMNDIFDKPISNLYFSRQEMEFACAVDLFDRNSIDMAKIIWKRKDNKKFLNLILKMIKDNQVNDFTETLSELIQRASAVNA